MNLHLQCIAIIISNFMPAICSCFCYPIIQRNNPMTFHVFLSSRGHNSVHIVRDSLYNPVLFRGILIDGRDFFINIWKANDLFCAWFKSAERSENIFSWKIISEQSYICNKIIWHLLPHIHIQVTLVSISHTISI